MLVFMFGKAHCITVYVPTNLLFENVMYAYNSKVPLQFETMDEIDEVSFLHIQS